MSRSNTYKKAIASETKTIASAIEQGQAIAGMSAYLKVQSGDTDSYYDEDVDEVQNGTYMAVVIQGFVVAHDKSSRCGCIQLRVKPAEGNFGPELAVELDELYANKEAIQEEESHRNRIATVQKLYRKIIQNTMATTRKDQTISLWSALSEENKSKVREECLEYNFDPEKPTKMNSSNTKTLLKLAITFEYNLSEAEREEAFSGYNYN